MEFYDYLKAETADVKTFMLENDLDPLDEHLSDKMFNEDSITGNGSGSYTMNQLKAEENLCGNYELLLDAMEDLGCDYRTEMLKGAETLDVIIRCYLLDLAIEKACYEIFDDEFERGKKFMMEFNSEED